MTNQRVQLFIPFHILIDTIAELDLDKKRRLWQLLDEQIDQTETLQEARIPYQTEDHITEKGATQTEILEELRKLPAIEQLAIIETVLFLVRQKLQQTDQASTLTNKDQDLTVAAKALLSDYTVNNELTAFTVLDGEDFYASG